MNFIKALFLFSFLNYYSFSQTFNYRHFTVENGLASSNVYAAYQDSKGYIWFGTEEGVSRFDGKNFSTYRTEEGLSDNDVLRIVEDKSGRVWFLTFSGHLSFFSQHDQKIHNENTDRFLARAYNGSGFFSAFVDSKSRVWFCSLTGRISMLDSGDAVQIHLSDSETSGEAYVSEDKNRNIFAFCGAKKFQLNEHDFSFKTVDTLIPAPVTTYFASPNGNVFYESEKDIICITDGSIKKAAGNLYATPVFPDVVTITNDSNTLFLSTRHNGVVSVDLAANGPGKILHYPIKKQVNSVTIDNENNIWFLTRGEGVYMLPSQLRNALVYPLEYFNNDDIFSILYDVSGSYWIGGNENKIFRFNNGSFKSYMLPFVNKKTLGRVIDLKKDNEKNIWACTDAGLFKIITSPDSKTLEPKRIFSCVKDVRTINITFNSKNKGVFTTPLFLGSIISKNAFEQNYEIPVHDLTENKRTYFAYYDLEGRLFVSNINGLNEVKEDSLVCYGNTDSLLSVRIVFIAQAKDSALVLGSDGNGLIFFKNGTVINHITSKDGLASGICRKIVVHGDDIFVCTNRGLTVLHYVSNHISGFNTYTIFNGLASNDVRDVAVTGNTLYAVTSKGLSILEISETSMPESPPPLYITSISGITNEVMRDSNLTLSFKNNFLKVQYIAITFNKPSEITYQYSLDQKNENWISTFSNEIVFSDLAPGSYTFSVRAKKANSGWSKSASVSFMINPPFYKTWWFIFLCAVAATSFITLLFIYLSRRKQRSLFLQLEKKNALNIERHRISADMHDDLGSDLSKIAITAEIIKMNFPPANSLHTQVQKITDNAGSARKKMDDIIWALNPSNDNLGDLIGYVNKYCLEYFEGTTINVHVFNEVQSEFFELNARQRRNIFLVIKETSANVLKHSEAKNFHVRFFIKDNRLHITAADDGKGFNPDALKAGGSGLKNIKKRITDINGNMGTTFKQGTGVVYAFSIPF